VTLGLAQDLERGRDDGAGEVAMVVRALVAGGWDLRHGRSN
jgi:hypothetical protein